jgi:flagellar assembly protein FliH
MAVIKSTHAAALVKDAIVLDLGDLRRQGERLRAAAQLAAARIATEARAKADQLIGSAHQEGLEKGLNEGRARGLEEGRREGRAQALRDSAEEFRKVQQAWLDAAQQWETRRQALEREGRRTVLEVALALGRKITHRVIEVDASIVSDQLAQALVQVLRPQDLTVRINPADREVVSAAMPLLSARFPQLAHVHLVDDAQVARGGCVVNCGQGAIDADIETQLRRIAEVLLPDRTAGPDSPAPSAASLAP